MKARLNYAKAAAGVYDAMDALDGYLQRCGLEKSLLLLCQLRASQINGAINAWNRLSIAARIVPGAYKPAKVAS
jgi:hypothetical protein